MDMDERIRFNNITKILMWKLEGMSVIGPLMSTLTQSQPALCQCVFISKINNNQY